MDHPQLAPHQRLTQADNLTTLQSHILAEEARHPRATGNLSWILSALSLSAKVIASKIRRARLNDVLGSLEVDNVQGERQQKLDVIANETLIRCLGSRSSVAIVASEEDEQPILLRTETEGERRYVVLFDPLDGSSNIDVSVGVGTIFSIIRNDPGIPGAMETVCQPGSTQVAAGYILYGSSVVFVLTTGNGVDMFVLDQSIGAFILARKDLRIPESGKTYSLNEAYRGTFPDGYNKYLDWAHVNGYSSRYIGSMVADVHRTLLKGGVFLYPPTKKNPEGKLRLMYEANPMAMLIEHAGGKAVASHSGVGGAFQRILEIQPKNIHQRTSVVLGSPAEVDAVTRCL